MAKETGGTVIAVPTELRSDAAVAAMKDRVLAEFGRIDILVNVAATVTPADFLQLDEAEFLDVFEQNLNGYARCLRHIQIGRASCRARVCQYVSISGVAVSLKKKNSSRL